MQTKKRDSPIQNHLVFHLWWAKPIESNLKSKIVVILFAALSIASTKVMIAADAVELARILWAI